MRERKAQMPIPHLVRPGSGRKKLVVLLAVTALLWWVISDPTGAATKVTTVVRSIVTFVSLLFG